MFDLGIQELIVIFIVALIVLGPKKLPDLGRSLGKGLGELKKAMQGVKEQMDTELKELKAPMFDTKTDTQTAKTEKEKTPHASDTDKADDDVKGKGV